MTGLDDILGSRLAQLDARHLRRTLRTLSGGPAPRVDLDGREVIQFCSNDYLGLAADPRLKQAAVDAVGQFGCGAGSSRLVGGTTSLHAALEEALAGLKATAASLVFTSGYHANIGVLSALVESGDTVFSDARNHASLIDGCRLSRATVVVYRHLDVEHLRRLLASAPGAGRRFIVTETVFSMDGDVAPLEDLVDAARRWDASILVDEAHATGVYGPRGGGVVEELGLGADIAVQVGTLGKALGSLGAFAAGSAALVDWLTNTARSFVYTTALSPPAVAAALTAVDIVGREPERRQRLWDHAEVMRARLTDLGFRVGAHRSPILPVFVGDDERAVRLSAELLARGVLVPAIRPPTVPPGTARLRVVPMATHRAEDVEAGLDVFAAAGRASGVLR
jgi:8-amino-7-oxononanoate synthase